MKKVACGQPSLILTGLLLLTTATHGKAVAIDFSDEDRFDQAAIGASQTYSDLILTTKGITGFVDNTSTSALSSAGHVTNTGLGGLAVNSVGNGGCGSSDVSQFNPREAWTFSFDKDVKLVDMDFSGFAETGTGWLITSSAFSDINIQLADVDSKETYTFAPGIVASAGTDITITFTKTGVFNAGDASRIDSMTVSIIPESGGSAQVAVAKYVYEGAPRFAYGFSSDMVIQRDTEANVWGFANPGRQVTVSIAGERLTGVADEFGQWLVQLPPMEAGGRHTLKLESGATEVALENVLFGDVWICSGQSNMRYKLGRRSGKEKDAPFVFESELAALEGQDTFPIRHAMENRGKFEWLKVTRETATDESKNPSGVTAVGYFFAKYLRENLGDVPIGIIQTGSGGKAIRHFIPKDIQWEHPDLKSVWFTKPSWKKNTYFEELVDKHGETKLAQHEAAIRSWLNGESESEACPTYIVNYPGYLFYNALPPLRKLKFKGMVWYQGESDRGGADTYSDHLEILIDFYRQYFDRPDLPVITVALPPHDLKHYGDFVGAQIAFADRKEGVAIAYAPEGGDEKDIHSPKKEIVGKRAALSALSQAYGKNVAYLGPRLASARRVGDRVIVDFNDVASGLKLAEGATKLTGFQMSTDNKEESFEDVVAYDTLSSKRVELAVPEKFGQSDLFLRFNWTPFYSPVLYGSNGLPAVPFFCEVK